MPLPSVVGYSSLYVQLSIAITLVRKTVAFDPFMGNQQEQKAHANLQRSYKCSVLVAQNKDWGDYCEEIKISSIASILVFSQNLGTLIVHSLSK